MTPQTINARLLRDVAARVRQPSNEFNQCDWLFCIAGHTCALAGDVPVTSRGYAPGSKVQTLDGETMHVQDRARQLLGLTHVQSVLLFDALPDCSWPRPFAERWEEARAKRDEDDRSPATLVEREICADLLEWIADRVDAGLPINRKPLGADSWIPLAERERAS